MTERRASCSCGQLRLAVRGEPSRISICHCLACQRRTGSAFGFQARFPQEAVSIEGQSTEFLRTAESGGNVSFHFCPQCGATVFYYLSNAPGQIAVPVGVFADRDFPAPWVSVYTELQHRWLRLPDGIEFE